MNTIIKSKSPTIRRILREAQELASTPSSDYVAVPLETDLFEWHFTLRGPPSSPYSEGIYHGRISLPSTYPLRPPNFRFVTPNGRFETNREICLSISGHHEETWQPAWGVRTALVALRSFMETNPEGQVGGLTTTKERRRDLAAQSKAFRCSACGKSNAEIMAECEERVKEEGESAVAKEVEVPKELRMGFKDEMDKKAQDPAGVAAAAGGSNAAPPPTTDAPTGPPAAASGSWAERQPPTGAAPRIVTRTDSIDSETAALAEGFVQTAQTQPTTTTTTTTTTTRTQQHPRARPGQGVPQPTGTAMPPPPLGDQAALAQRQRQQQQLRRGNDGVPRWVDNGIYGIMVLLIIMVLKVLAS